MRGLQQHFAEHVVEHDAMVAVTAHRLMTTIAMIAGSAATLKSGWHRLSEVERRELLERIEGHAVLASAGLRDAVLGVLPSAG